MQRVKHSFLLRLKLIAILMIITLFMPFPVNNRLLTTSAASALSSITRASYSNPVMFVENVGQYPDGARFQVHGSNHAIWLTEDALWVTFVSAEAPQKPMNSGLFSDKVLPTRQGVQIPGKGVNLRLSFVGANPDPHIEPSERLETQVSFFTGSDLTKWSAAVPVWGEVRYLDLYPGIDLIVRSNNSQLDMQLAAQSGADLGLVRLQVEGADGVSVESGVLRMVTAVGEFTLPLPSVEGGPVGGSTLAPSIERTASQTFEVAFPFSSSPSRSSSAAETSPSDVLLYSTYLGGFNSDEGLGIAVDDNGNIYVSGSTTSTDFPTSPGVFQPAYNDYHDIFIAKFNPGGSALLYATYLGGSDDECNYGGYPYVDCQVAVDADGNVYLFGFTLSSDFPTTEDAYDRSLGGTWDTFITKLNASGTELVYSTYLGGSLRELSGDIYVDEEGIAYVTGYAESADFPTTPGAYDTSGPWDAFVTKLNADGSDVVYSTLLGGSEVDSGSGITVDVSGNAYISGHTSSSDFPVTPGAYDITCGFDDSFIAKVNTTGTDLLYATCLGGSEFDKADEIVIDTSGTTFVVGHTQSTDFPTTPGAFDTTYNGGASDLYVTRLNADGSDLLYSTYLGGSLAEEELPAITLDSQGCVYLAGTTTSADFPTTPGAFDINLSGYSDGFITKLSPDGSHLVYSTYYGGSEGSSVDEFAVAIALDASGTVFVTGATNASDFPLTPDAYDHSLSFMGGDAFVSKFALPSLNTDMYVEAPAHVFAWPGGMAEITIQYGNTGAMIATQGTLTATLDSDLGYVGDTSGITPTMNGDIVVWNLPDLAYLDGGQFILQTSLPITASIGTIYPITLTIWSAGVEDEPTDNTANLEIQVISPVHADFSAEPTSGVAPFLVTFTDLSSGDYDKCDWVFGDGETSNLCDPTHNYTTPGVYSVTLTVSGLGGTDTETKVGYITIEEYKIYLPIIIRNDPGNVEN